MRSPGHIVSLIIWALFLINIFMPFPEDYSVVIYMVGFVILGAHIVELIVFSGRIRAAEGSSLYHMVMIMLFGVFHARELPKSQQNG